MSRWNQKKKTFEIRDENDQDLQQYKAILSRLTK